MSDKDVINKLIREIESHLKEYKASHKGLTWRNKVLLLVQINRRFKKVGINSNLSAAVVSSRERIKLYLQENVGVIISAKELEVVSGISEYGRRVRELRVEDGYKIITGQSNDPESGITIKPTEYLLIDKNPDITAARRWRLANRIRRETKGGSRGRLIHYFLENIGQILTTEELAYVAKAREFGRRIRELRTEQGYAIATQFTGRPDLKMGEYILETADRIAEPHDRKISYEVQKAVYERSKNTCQLCGWNHSKWSNKDPRILELHHIEEHATGGMNTLDNLCVLCSRCHDGIHAKKLDIPHNFS